MLPPHLHSRLESLATFHKVMAVFVALFSSVFLFHVGFGLMALLNPGFLHEADGSAPPAFFGVMFLLIGGTVVLTGWTFAVCVWRVARMLRERRGWTFCLVVDAFLCGFAPLGTVLGIFGLMALMDPAVKAAFGRAPGPAPYAGGEYPTYPQ